jgi:hypothetical protein
MPDLTMTVSYSQIAVFDGRLDQPFNDWSDTHVRQGFSWRPNSVSFRTIIDGGKAEVSVEEKTKLVVSSKCVRAITVPFVVVSDGQYEIATITESHPISLDPGNYQLVFETGNREGVNWIRLSFVKDGDQAPSILVTDAELKPQVPLLMTAKPA